MQDKNFFQWVFGTVDGVEPISILKGLVICIVLAVLDFFVPFVLVIAGFVFIKTGHHKMGILLALLNFLPDSLPCLDEIIGITIEYLTLLNKYKKAIDISNKASGAISTVKKKII